ncbi:MAG TPA: hypothetical protein VEJ63_23880 [Planctomycetota bacterium]|nr:hypothetical protein [Planctomycetota bacterium]
MNPDSERTTHPLGMKAGAIGLALLALASCWAMPLKMLLGDGGSYYTFAVIGDEMIYANRTQPLLAGATIQNPLNGVCDPNILSPYLLEDVVREVVTLSGVHIITFFWIWRFIYPVVLLASLVVLARAVLPKRNRGWPEILIFAAGFQALYFIVYAITVDYPPMGGWILRIPTNVEYPIAALLGAGVWNFALHRRLQDGLLSAMMLSALIYLRPYSAMPWAIALFLALIAMAARRQLRIKTTVIVAAALLLSLVPLLYIFQHNAALPSYRETMLRYFRPVEYEIHKNAPYFIAIGIIYLLAAWKGHRRLRPLLCACAFVMLLLPFISGAFASIRDELLSFDRYTPFYFTLIAACCGLLLKLSEPRRVVAAVAAAGALCLAVNCIRYGSFDYSKYHLGSYGYIQADLRSIPAYDWIRKNTPADAMILTDERIHWGALEWTHWSEGLRATWVEDLFLVVARRRPVYHWRMYGNFMSHAQYADLVWLQRATFGMQLKDEAAADRAYAKLLSWYRPGYILWRKGRPGLRGRGARLEKIASVEYSDDACEIWKLNYPHSLERGQGQPEDFLAPAR